MNITIAHRTVDTWKRFKIRYVAAACSGALALSLVVRLSGAYGGDSPAARSAGQPIAWADYAPTSQPSGIVVYLVSSREQADLYQDSSGRVDNSTTYAFEVVDTPERELIVERRNATTALELALAGTPFQVIDLR